MKYATRLILALALMSLTGCATTARRHCYEYRIEYGGDLPALQEKINELGKDGWIVQSFAVTDNLHKYVVLRRDKME